MHQWQAFPDFNILKHNNNFTTVVHAVHKTKNQRTSFFFSLKKNFKIWTKISIIKSLMSHKNIFLYKCFGHIQQSWFFNFLSYMLFLTSKSCGWFSSILRRIPSMYALSLSFTSFCSRSAFIIWGKR